MGHPALEASKAAKDGQSEMHLKERSKGHE